MWVPDVRFAGLVFVSLAQHSNQTVSSERSVMWRSGVLPFLVQTLTLCCVQRFRRASQPSQSHIAHSTVSVRMRQTCAHITGSVFYRGSLCPGFLATPTTITGSDVGPTSAATLLFGNGLLDSSNVF